MKTWEIMQHSGKEFIRKSDGLTIEITEDGTLNWLSGYMHLNTNDEWEEVKEPVTFLEAVESGQYIRVEHERLTTEADKALFSGYDNLSSVLFLMTKHFNAIALRDILLNGKWYIE